jgi:hypothetical protein
MNISSIILIALALLGCANGPSKKCKPVLFPYVEYGYKAEPVILDGSYSNDQVKQSIDIFGLKLISPEGWHLKISNDQTVKFVSKSGRFFLVLYNKDTPFLDEPGNFNFIGCDDFNSNNKYVMRSDKDVTSAIYLFADEDLKGEPTFWQYFILWSKTKILRDAVKLVHFRGKQLEAFQKNHDPSSLCVHGDIACQIEIFPDKIAPDSLTVAAGFVDDAFFAEFLDMLDTLNP